MSNRTKKALFSSVLALLLCATILLGSTYAWFTDAVTTSQNKIVVGNLDIELHFSRHSTTSAGFDWQMVDSNSNIFDDTALWEPGHVEIAYLWAKNAGTLALEFDLTIEIAAEQEGTNVFNETFWLSDHLKAGLIELTTIAPYTSHDAAKTAIKDTAYGLKSYKDSDVLLYKEAKLYALIVYMPEEVGNEANYLTGTEPPHIDLGLNLFATQTPHENDSFGPDYDADAPHPDDGGNGSEGEGGNEGSGEGGNEGSGEGEGGEGSGEGENEGPVDIRTLGTGGFAGLIWVDNVAGDASDADSGWRIRQYRGLPFDVPHPEGGTVTIQPMQGTTPMVPDSLFSGDVSGETKTGPIVQLGDETCTETSDIVWTGVTEVTLGNGNYTVMHRTLPAGVILNVQPNTTFYGSKSSAFGADLLDSTLWTQQGFAGGTIVTFKVACDTMAEIESSELYTSLSAMMGGSIPNTVVFEAVGAASGE